MLHYITYITPDMVMLILLVWRIGFGVTGMEFVGVPTGCEGKLRWQTTGMFGEAAMAEPWDGVGKAAMAGTHKAQEEASGWVRCSR
jgi:hypothetical protein